MSVDEIKALPIKTQVEIVYDLIDEFDRSNDELLLNFKPILIALRESGRKFDNRMAIPYIRSVNFREDRIEETLKHKFIAPIFEGELLGIVRKPFCEWLNLNKKSATVKKKTFNGWLNSDK